MFQVAHRNRSTELIVTMEPRGFSYISKTEESENYAGFYWYKHHGCTGLLFIGSLVRINLEIVRNVTIITEQYVLINKK